MKLKGIKKSVALLLVVAMVITLLPPLAASTTYHLTFTNDEGFYGFWAEQPASDEPDDYVGLQRSYMPVTVNVKYSDGTKASGIKVTTDYAYKGATQNVTTDAKITATWLYGLEQWYLVE